jgi:hypothetical protein
MLGAGDGSSLKTWNKMPEPSVRAKPLVLVDIGIISVSSSNNRGFEIALGTLRSELRRMFGAGDGNNFEADDTLPEQNASD